MKNFTQEEVDRIEAEARIKRAEEFHALIDEVYPDEAEKRKTLISRITKKSKK